MKCNFPNQQFIILLSEIGELSRGERQRVIIARALAQEPKLMLLDEPTAHLDINHKIEILNLVKKLCLKEEIEVIVALHDLNLASQYCDRIFLLYNGKVYAEGTPKEVITKDIIEQVYGVKVLVYPHPLNGLPTVFC